MKTKTYLACLAAILFVSKAGFPAGTHAAGDHETKLRLELFSGVTFVSPSDLNRGSAYLAEIDRFFYDDYLDYLRNHELNPFKKIQSWSKSATGSFDSLNAAVPFGLRLKYDLTRRLALSLGLSYTAGDRKSDVNAVYTRMPHSSKKDQETLSYEPYAVSISAVVPSLGLHYRIPLGRKLGLEFGLAAGPLLAECRYDYTRNYEWKVFYLNDNAWFGMPEVTDRLTFEQNGRGTGISMELAAGLDFRLSGTVSAFIDTAYTVQRAGNIKGEGRLDRNGAISEWDGVWKMNVEKLETFWGTYVGDWPGIGPQDGPGNVSRSRFMLDLSGFSLRVGLRLILSSRRTARQPIF